MPGGGFESRPAEPFQRLYADYLDFDKGQPLIDAGRVIFGGGGAPGNPLDPLGLFETSPLEQPAAGAGFNPIGLVVTAGLMLYSFIGRPNGKDRRTKGYGFEFRDNPNDPNDPIGIAYGRPVLVPPVLFRYLTSPALNKPFLDEPSTQTLVVCLSLGAGPIDGRDIKVWMNDEILHESITEDSPDVTRTLRSIDGKTYVFQSDNVVPSSVVIFKDGAEYARGGEGGTVNELSPTTFTGSPVVPRRIKDTLGIELAGFDHDPDASTITPRVGGLPPSQGIRDEASVTIKFPGYRHINFGTTPAAGVFQKNAKAPPENLHWGTLDDGREYFYITTFDNRLDDLITGAGGDKIRFSFTGKIQRRVRVEQNADGAWMAIFAEDLSGSTITATFDTSVVGDDLKFTLRKGEADQDPLPVDGIRNARTIGTELLQGVSVTHNSTREVDDMEVLLESGSAGFTDVAISGRNAGEFRDAARRVKMWVRETGADDGEYQGTDPAKGWVKLLNPVTSRFGKDTFKLIANTNGTARWFFSVADLLAFTQGKTSENVTGNNFPKRTEYDVRVMATDVAGNRGESGRDDGVESDLFFGKIQEVLRTKLSLPLHATLTLEISDLERIPQEPVFAVQVRGRKVWVPDSTATYDSETGRLEPGSLKWTRNPVWCATDLIADPHFGAGEYFTWDGGINTAAAFAAETWCDGTEGGETRAEIDTWLNTRATLWDQVGQIVAGGKILPSLDGGQWRFLIDQDGSSVLGITEADIEDGTLVKAYPSLEEVPTELEAAFTDEEQDFELDTEVRRVGTEPTQRVVRRIDLTGVRRRSQVGRVLDLALAQFRLNRSAVEFRAAGWRLLVLEAGDIVTLTATEVGAAGEKYRVAAIGYGSDFRPTARLERNHPNAYASPLPNSIVPPNLRPPSASVSTVNKPAGAGAFIGYVEPPVLSQALSFSQLTATRLE